MQEHILLHVCCGPCAIVPVLRLREQGHIVTGIFLNPNIHPLSEYLRRREAMQIVAEKLNLPMLWKDNTWNINKWLSDVNSLQNAGQSRCNYCYASRINKVARIFQESKKFTSFSTSLLYSRYQNHENIIACAHSAAKQYDISFYYEDFRSDWQKGIDISKEMNVYRQAYCGCIYSEAERYAKKLAKLI